MTATSSPPQRLAFISGNRGWGGSEELWSATAAVLAQQGHKVAVFKSAFDPRHPRMRRLRELGCSTVDLARLPLLPASLFDWLGRISRASRYVLEATRLLIGLLLMRRVDLLVLSQGGNFDGIHLGWVCRFLRMPYVLICQKATDLYWPIDERRPHMIAMYESVRHAFFVSEHNRRVTEEQLGFALPHASVVRNPFLVSWDSRNDWPDESHDLRLACVGRLEPLEKGQDLLLRVLARDRWRARAIHVSFFGNGNQRDGLIALAQHLKLANVSFPGFVDPASIWNDHHAAVLPSRCEGLPLVLVEAMLCGRVAIATNVGGNAEVIEDDVSGFIANAPTEDAIDEAMNRAWLRREEWREIGAIAARRIRELVPRHPEEEFAAEIVRLANA